MLTGIRGHQERHAVLQTKTSAPELDHHSHYVVPQDVPTVHTYSQWPAPTSTGILDLPLAQQDGTAFTMHSHLLLIASTALLSLSSVLAEALFYDNRSFPLHGEAASVQSTSLQAGSGKAVCTLVTYTAPRTYKRVAEPGPSCSYQSWISISTTNASKANGIRQCKDTCAQTAACRSFSWYTDSTEPSVGNCAISYNFYDPSFIQCDNSTNPNTYLAVYNVASWTPPNPLLPNGNFETGCLDPWFFEDFTSDDSMHATVVDCRGDCAPHGGNRYVKVTGNGQNGSTRDHIDAYIGQQPALTDDVTYRLTAHVRGDGGEFRFTYPVHTSVVVRANATADWRQVSGTFTGRNVGTFLIQMDATGQAKFAVDNVKIVAV